MDSDEHSNQHWAARWIFALTTLSLLTIVFIVAPFLSADAKHSISYEVVYWYELGLMCLAVLAMVVHIVYLLKRNCQGDDVESTRLEGITGTVSSRTEEDEENPSCSCSYECLWAVFKGIAKYIEPFVIALCGIGSVILPIFEIYNISNCVHMENNRMYIARELSLVFIVGFSLVETVWLLILQRPVRFIDVTKWQNAIAIMFIILGNLILCVRSIVDTVRASTTRAYGKTNATLPQHFFDVTLVFSKCSNNTEIADTDVILSVYRFTYSFPFQLGFLALKLIFSVLFKTSNGNKIHGQPNTEKENIGYCEKIALKISKGSNICCPFIVLAFSITYIALEILSGTLKNVDESANSSEYTLVIYVISLVHTIIYTLAPFGTLLSFWILEVEVTSKLDFNKCPLMFCAIGNIFLCLFEIVDSCASVNHISDKDFQAYEGVYITTLIFRIFGIYCQMNVIFDSHVFLDPYTFNQNKQTCSHVRAILIFIAFDNGLRWLIVIVCSAPALKEVYEIKEDGSFGDMHWWLVVKLFTPIVLLYRLLSSMMCFKLAAEMQYLRQENQSVQYDELQSLLPGHAPGQHDHAH